MIARVARHPVVVLLAIAVAVACGAAFRAFSLAIEPLGDFYVGLLKMCVIPMLFSIVALSIMRLMVSENARRHTVAVLWVFPLLLAATAGVATLFGVVTHGGGAPTPAALASLGVAVFSAEKPIEVELNGPPP
ncbi:MAG TPA: cation:dicarboxylase symporter family transporter, partial [Candidatus Aquilonibacter sp.]|nr:cation:dicarboxylase symporter family transporter [Candidatus Aquilonibacter sp.]